MNDSFVWNDHDLNCSSCCHRRFAGWRLPKRGVWLCL